MHLYRKYTIHRQRHANVCKYRLGRLTDTGRTPATPFKTVYRGSCADPWHGNIVVARTDFFSSPKQQQHQRHVHLQCILPFLLAREEGGAAAATGVCNIVVKTSTWSVPTHHIITLHRTPPQSK